MGMENNTNTTNTRMSMENYTRIIFTKIEQNRIIFTKMSMENTTNTRISMIERMSMIDK